VVGFGAIQGPPPTLLNIQRTVERHAAVLFSTGVCFTQNLGVLCYTVFIMNRRTLYVAAAFIAAAPFAVVAWTGPTGAPPNNNANGPVWLQTGAVTAQTGKISISGATISAATTTQDLYVTSGKSIRADGSGATTFNFGNYGTGSTGFTLGVNGNLNVLGFSGTGSIAATQYCFSGFTGCITSWPSGGGGPDVYVNTTGDTMSGALYIQGNVGGAYAPLNISYGGGNTAVYINSTSTGAGDGIVLDAAEHGIISRAVAGRGLWGVSTNSAGVTGETGAAGAFGGIFYNNSTGLNARALVGVADASVSGTSPTGAIGVDGFAANGTGVRGYAANQRSAGVYGFGFYGVQGSGLTGVRGDGTSAFGVEGRGPTAGVIGYSTGGGGTSGVRGENAVANSQGMYGINTGSNGMGVYGTNSAGLGIGIYGVTTAAGTRAIRGYANVSDGIGVQGEAGDANGIGVHGIATTGNSNAIGVKGESNSPGGYAMYALTSGSAQTAIMAENPVSNGTAVYGVALGASTATDFSSGNYSRGIYGFTNQQYAVGVEGFASQANAYGMRGGTAGSNSSGVYGYTSAGTNGMGVRGAAFQNGGYGIYGSAVAINGIGVYGEGYNQGVVGASTNSGGSGVYGYNNTASGRGVYGEATNAGTGIGGWFNGALYDVNAVGGRFNSSAATMRFYVAGTEQVRFAAAGATTKSAGTTWGTAFSDARLKDVQGPFKGGLNEIMKLNPVYFNWKKGNSEGLESDMKHLGFIAQDVQKVFPEMVAKRESGYLGIDSYDPIMWAMLNSIKELKNENDSLKDKLESLEERLEKLEAAN
jgi:hypothetical protein